jgi:hypothetical protein
MADQMASKPMGMLLQDPTLRDDNKDYLHTDYPFSPENDFLIEMGSSKFVIRDEDEEANVPMFAGLDWGDPNQELTFEHFNQRPLERPICDNPQFHQVNVFAVAAHTLRSFEEALGRELVWRHGGPLVIRPHAFQGDNAYYDPNSPSLNFGYFDSPFRPETVWTCLSHDIIAHELGHAAFDSLRYLFNFTFEIDTDALHESIGDLFALFSALEHPALVDRLYKESGEKGVNMRDPTFVSNLGEEFGIGLEGAGTPYLRSALEGLPYDPDFPDEPHARSQVWTAAVYEILIEIVESIGSAGTDTRKSTFDRFKQDVVKATRLTRAMLVRALHYTPPTSVTMPVLARLIYDADERLFPDEPKFRKIAKRVFEQRRLWDEDLVFDAPGIGDAFNDFEDADVGARFQMVVNQAEALRIPLAFGPRILTPRLVTATRQLDTFEEEVREADRQAVTERYLNFAYEFSDTIIERGPSGPEPRGVAIYFGGTLVMDENFNAVALVTDPPVIAADLQDSDPARNVVARAIDRFHAAQDEAIRTLQVPETKVASGTLYGGPGLSLKVQGTGPARIVRRPCNIADHLRAISHPRTRFPYASRLGRDRSGSSEI